MNPGAVSVAQTALSAVSQVGNLRAWPDPDASLVFTPCRLPVGDTADYQSALQRWRFMGRGQVLRTWKLPMNLKNLPLICNDLCILGSWPVSRSKRNRGLSMNPGNTLLPSIGCWMLNVGCWMFSETSSKFLRSAVFGLLLAAAAAAQAASSAASKFVQKSLLVEAEG